MKCPCFSNKDYEKCCKLYHDGEKPPTPTDLMRSRYSAYAMKNAPYIMKTTHASHPDQKLPQKQWETQILDFCTKTKFTGLEIVSADGVFVTFLAHLEQDGHDASFSEKSVFEKEDGFWCYKSADSLH